MGIMLPPAVAALSALLFPGALILAVVAQRTMGAAWQAGIKQDQLRPSLPPDGAVRPAARTRSPQ